MQVLGTTLERSVFNDKDWGKAAGCGADRGGGREDEFIRSLMLCVTDGVCYPDYFYTLTLSVFYFDR